MLKYYALMQYLLARPLRRDDGATAVEYGLIVALIAAAMAGILLAIGIHLNTMFTGIKGYL
jgi:pilus assembly protein Flp/PilA